MKIVVDTNLLVSAFIKKGPPRDLMPKLGQASEELILSREILEEFLDVVEDEKIRKHVDEKDVTDFLGILENIARVISAKSKVKVVREDPTDDMVFRTAYSAKADYIVSGDKHVLHIKKYRSIRVVTVREMLEMI